MANQCTKRIVDYAFRDRAFCMTNRDKPFILKLVYERFYPDGWIAGTQVFFTNESFIVVDDPEKWVNKFKRGYCLQCGNINNCTAKKYKFT